MDIAFKKIFILWILILLVFPLELSQTEAASAYLAKTVEFFIGQDNAARASGEQFNFYFDNVIIPETPIVKSAVLEINGVSYNNSGDQTINVDLVQGVNPAGLGIDYKIAGTAKAKPFTIKYDALQNGTGPMSNITAAYTVYDYTLYLKGISSGGAGSYSISSAKLILTYDSPASSAYSLKTTNFFIGQETGNTGNGVEIAKDFKVSIYEEEPMIRSIFVETSGIAKGNGMGTIEISVVDQGSPANYASYSIDLGPISSTAKFKIIYDASADILSSDFPGDKNYTLYLKGTGFSTNIWNAKILVTYQYKKPSGGLPVSGYIISSTIDTGITKGAAFNALMWRGNLNGGKVRLQFAASNCQSGQSDYPLCSIGNWGDINTPYAGPDCTSNTSYESFPDISSEIGCAVKHNNKRYFRYKITLCSAADCILSGMGNPEVTDVVVNWSP